MEIEKSKVPQNSTCLKFYQQLTNHPSTVCWPSTDNIQRLWPTYATNSPLAVGFKCMLSLSLYSSCSEIGCWDPRGHNSWDFAQLTCMVSTTLQHHPRCALGSHTWIPFPMFPSAR